MSTYASGSNNPAERPLRDAPQQEVLFNYPPVDVPRQLGAAAVTGTLAETERTTPFRFPLTVTEQLRQARMAEGVMPRTIESAYDELGGHAHPMTCAEQTERALDGYEPWMRDIHVAVERYGLLELTAQSVAAMTQKDRDTLALYVDGFREGLRSARQLIASKDGDVRFDDFFTKYQRHTPAEMIAYGQRLAALQELLDAQTGYTSLIRHAYATWGGDTKQGAQKRHQVRRRNKITKGDTPFVVFDEAHSKWRVDYTPLQRNDG